MRALFVVVKKPHFKYEQACMRSMGELYVVNLPS